MVNKENLYDFFREMMSGQIAAHTPEHMNKLVDPSKADDECSFCGGTGLTDTYDTCPYCDGSGLKQK